jgi:hypothetical protein
MVDQVQDFAVGAVRARWSPVPDWASGRRLIWASLATSLAAAAALTVIAGASVSRTLGDTDDALRLVRVQELLHGKPWFQDVVARVQPPEGLALHWSRLIDGGIAGLIQLFRLAAPEPAAETAARFVWPLLWLFPTALATLALARRVGGRTAVFACALMLPVSLPALTNFHPGRIDHHNIQEMLCVVALACAVAADRRALWGAAAGMASGLALAIGLEALAFHAVIAVLFAARLLIGEPARRPTLAYALGLGLSAAGFFAVQTPPAAWGATACDALGANLLGGVVVGSAGLAAAAAVRKRGVWPAAGGLGLAAAAALAVLIRLDPSCVHGPFAHMDPRLQIWLGHVEEMLPIWAYWLEEPVIAAAFMATPLVALVIFALGMRRPEKRCDPVWILMGAMLAGATAMSVIHIRSQPYAGWLALPLIGAGVAELSGRWRGLMAPTALAALALSPAAVAAASPLIQIAAGLSGGATAPSTGHRLPPAGAPDRCNAITSYRLLATLPPGLVLAEADLGPFVLAHTPHAVVAAPYHRAARGMVAAMTALRLPPAEAGPFVRGLGATYVVNCPAHASSWDHVVAGPQSLTRLMDRGGAPPWLRRLSPPQAPLQVYAVRN